MIKFLNTSRHKLLTLFIIGALYAAPVSAQITTADTPDHNKATTASNVTIANYNIGAASRILFVCMSSGGTNTPFSVTYNSVALTSIAGVNYLGYRAELFYIVNPSTGTHDIVGSLGAGLNSIIMTASSYAGAKQTGVPDSSNTGNNGTSATIVVSTTVVDAGSWGLLCATGSNPAVMSGGTNATLRATDTDGSFINGGIFDSNTTTGSGSFTMTGTYPNTAFGDGVIVSFAPASGGGGGSTPFRFPCAILGVGCH